MDALRRTSAGARGVPAQSPVITPPAWMLVFTRMAVLLGKDGELCAPHVAVRGECATPRGVAPA
jgi:hypothetical protein